MAVGGDLAFPFVEGRRTMMVRVLNEYMAMLLRAAETDAEVALAFHRTINLANRPQALFAPGILKRVLFPRRPTAVPADAGRPLTQAA